MTSPAAVAAFHGEYDRHPGDRVRFFAAVREFVTADASVLYPGSYVDIGPSTWFDQVTYVDTDKRAARFFAESEAVRDLIGSKRLDVGRCDTTEPVVTFHQLDYRDDLPIDLGSVDLLVSLYAGFVSEHCIRYLRPGGFIVVNDSHGDASMASLHPDNELIAVIEAGNGRYAVSTTDLDAHLRPKRGRPATAPELRQTNRGIAYTTPAHAYIFRHRGGPG